MSLTVQTALLSILRSLISTSVGYTIAKGWLPPDMQGEMIAALMVVVPAGFGVLDKILAERRAKAREQTGVQAGALAAMSGALDVHPEAIGPNQAQAMIKTMKENV